MRHPALTTILAAAVLSSLATAQNDERPYEKLQEATDLIATAQYKRAERVLVSLRSSLPKSYSLWYQLALVRKLQGRDKDAIEPAEKAAEVDPSQIAGLLLAGEVAAQVKPAAAKKYAQAAGKLAGKDAKALRRVIDLMLKLRDYKAASPLLEIALTKSPTDIQLVELAAKVALGAKDLKRAEAAYRQLMKLQPRDPTHPESLGTLLTTQGKKGKAIEAYQTALKIRPSNLAVRTRMVRLMTELAYDAKAIAVQRRYIEYYKWVHKRAPKPPQAGR